MTTCFISYDRDDEEKMEILAYVLEREGYSPWIDTEGVFGGQDWQSVINQALTDADFCVLLITQNTLSSDAVKDEIALAKYLSKAIMPVRWDSSVTRRQIDTLQIGHIQYIDIEHFKFRNGMKRLLESLQKFKRVDATVTDLKLPKPKQSMLPETNIDPENESGSKYAPLIQSLNSLDASKDRVTLQFTEIEQIIGGKLPASARELREWWANDATRHVHSRLWLDAGWRAAGINMTNEQVTFTRLAALDRTYNDFFSKAKAELKISGMPLNQRTPNGASWFTIITFPRDGSKVADFSLTFTQKRQFRIELYIDTGDAEKNKKAFALLRNHETEIKSHTGEDGTLNFEELPDKRASRIAVYYPKQISIRSAEAELAKLQDWIVKTAPVFYNAIADLADQVLNEVMKD